MNTAFLSHYFYYNNHFLAKIFMNIKNSNFLFNHDHLKLNISYLQYINILKRILILLYI